MLSTYKYYAETVQNYIRTLTILFEVKARLKPPEKLAIIFDGRTTKDAHYLSEFATFPDCNLTSYQKMLPSLSRSKAKLRKTPNSTLIWFHLY